MAGAVQGSSGSTIEIVTVHENDPERGGCEFGIFFDGRTPKDLVDGGIYNVCACPMYLPLSSPLPSLSGYAGLATSHHVYPSFLGDRAGALLGAVLAGLCRSCCQGNGRNYYHRLPLAKFNN